jgi:OHCU decarboxylase
MTLEELNALTPDAAAEALRQCCGSRAWAAGMAAARPFEDIEALHAAADRIWNNVSRADWLEAFAAHPRIGERLAASTARSAAWSAEEQSGTGSASRSTLEALADVNAEYEVRFGYILIVCATGRSGEELLALARRRLRHDPETEVRVAAVEQAAITRLRLERLVTS